MNGNAGSSVGPEGGAVTCALEYGLGSETSQAERRLDKPEVDGSSPSPRTTSHTESERPKQPEAHAHPDAWRAFLAAEGYRDDPLTWRWFLRGYLAGRRAARGEVKTDEQEIPK
jgi:hypothetical protein